MKYFLWLLLTPIVFGQVYSIPQTGVTKTMMRGDFTELSWIVPGDFSADSLELKVKNSASPTADIVIMKATNGDGITVSYSDNSTVLCSMYVYDTQAFTAAGYYYDIYSVTDSVTLVTGLLEIRADVGSRIDGTTPNGVPVYTVALDTCDKTTGYLIGKDADNSTDWIDGDSLASILQPLFVVTDSAGIAQSINDSADVMREEISDSLVNYTVRKQYKQGDDKFGNITYTGLKSRKGFIVLRWDGIRQVVYDEIFPLLKAHDLTATMAVAIVDANGRMGSIVVDDAKDMMRYGMEFIQHLELDTGLTVNAYEDTLEYIDSLWFSYYQIKPRVYSVGTCLANNFDRIIEALERENYEYATICATGEHYRIDVLPNPNIPFDARYRIVNSGSVNLEGGGNYFVATIKLIADYLAQGRVVGVYGHHDSWDADEMLYVDSVLNWIDTTNIPVLTQGHGFRTTMDMPYDPQEVLEVEIDTDLDVDGIPDGWGFLGDESATYSLMNDSSDNDLYTILFNDDSAVDVRIYNMLPGYNTFKFWLKANSGTGGYSVSYSQVGWDGTGKGNGTLVGGTALTYFTEHEVDFKVDDEIHYIRLQFNSYGTSEIYLQDLTVRKK